MTTPTSAPPFPLVEGKYLIDTGPSPRGWHRIERFLRCPLSFWHAERAAAEGKVLPPSFPLVRGSIWHAALAHHYIRWEYDRRAAAGDARAHEQRDQFHLPGDAAGLVAARWGQHGEEALPLVLRAYAEYRDVFARERWRRVVGVERLLATEFVSSRTGRSWLYTARADLIVEDTHGKVWIYDHKGVGRIEDKVFRRYGISGQFHGLGHLGARAFGERFAGIVLNVAALGTPGARVPARIAMERRSPEPAPWLYAAFPDRIARAEEEIEALRDANAAAGRSAFAVEGWPAAMSEQTCVTPYGLCEWFETCRWGPQG